MNLKSHNFSNKWRTGVDGGYNTDRPTGRAVQRGFEIAKLRQQRRELKKEYIVSGNEKLLDKIEKIDVQIKSMSD